MGLLKSVRAAVWGWFPALRPGSMRALSEVTGVVRRHNAFARVFSDAGRFVHSRADAIGQSS